METESEVLSDLHMWIECEVLKHHCTVAVSRLDVVDDGSVEFDFALSDLRDYLSSGMWYSSRAGGRRRKPEVTIADPHHND